MLRVVLDTNVLISTLAFQGATRKIWDLAETKKFLLFTSEFIVSELERNLLKLGLNADHVELLIEDFKDIASVVDPKMAVSVIERDKSDNRILECALAANADVLVTGDRKHIRPLAFFRSIEIVTPREFLTKYFG